MFSATISTNYRSTFPVDVGEQLTALLQQPKPNVKALIFNGDLNLIDNFLANQWFFERLSEAMKLTICTTHRAWNYRDAPAGYLKQFRSESVEKLVTLATIKVG